MQLYNVWRKMELHAEVFYKGFNRYEKQLFNIKQKGFLFAQGLEEILHSEV